jgi:hypothetical protein
LGFDRVGVGYRINYRLQRTTECQLVYLIVVFRHHRRPQPDRQVEQAAEFHVGFFFAIFFFFKKTSRIFSFSKSIYRENFLIAS